MNVLMSIKPKWIELIASGKKTLEIRKSMPKDIKYPFKVYMYCTKGIKGRPFDNPWSSKYINFSLAGYNKGSWYDIEGTVVGEFTVNHITRFSAHEESIHFVDGLIRDGYTMCDDITSKYFGIARYSILRDSCLTGKEMVDYIGDNKIGFAWEISDVVIYDKPKQLSDFYKTCTKKDCDGCEFLHWPLETWETPYCDINEKRQIKRPPQSWCFVETERLISKKEIVHAIIEVRKEGGGLWTDDSVYDVVEKLTGISDVENMPKELIDSICAVAKANDRLYR